MSSLLHAVSDAVTGVIDDFGAWAIFVLMALESACIPVPSEVIQLYAGFMVSQDKLGLVTAILAGTIGNLVGSWVAWYVGVRGGRPFIERYGRYLHVTPRRLLQAERWFDRYGGRVVFWSRMLPIIRTFISLPAGIGRMPFLRFSVYTFLGALPWVTALTLAGKAVGDNWEDLESRLKLLDYAIAALIVAAVIVLVVRARRGRTARRAAAELDG